MTTRAIIGGIERTMEHRPPNTVQCDVPGCRIEIYVERFPRHGGSGAHAARAQAGAMGWCFRDGLDLCPSHLDWRLP